MFHSSPQNGTIQKTVGTKKIVAENIGFTLRQAREAHDLSQSQCAERVGIYQQQLAEYENGIHMPSGETMIRLMIVLGIEVKDFLAHIPSHILNIFGMLLAYFSAVVQEDWIPPL